MIHCLDCVIYSLKIRLAFDSFGISYLMVLVFTEWNNHIHGPTLWFPTDINPWLHICSFVDLRRFNVRSSGWSEPPWEKNRSHNNIINLSSDINKLCFDRLWKCLRTENFNLNLMSGKYGCYSSTLKFNLCRFSNKLALTNW